MSAQIINLADRRKIKHAVPDIVALSFGMIAAYLFVGAVIIAAVVRITSADRPS